MSVKRIGLLGFGTVGTGVLELVSKNMWERFEVTKIGVRDTSKARAVEFFDVTSDLARVIQSDDVDIVVEVMGGIDPALALIKKALTMEKPVVTANKELIAKHYDELMAFGGDLRFEAAVAGGIPIIQVLRTLVQTNRIHSIQGILNGTTNFILTEMEKRGVEFPEILEEAQALGYAEADPTADVDGFDAMYKIAILGAIATGEQLDLDGIFREGIRDVRLGTIQAAAKAGKRIKLIASWTMEAGARVTPVALPIDHPLARVDGTFNAVTIVGDFVGELTLLGRGAGGHPTASAVCGDLANLS